MSSPLTGTAGSLLDARRLSETASRHREAYAAAEPFPHIVLDQFFPEEILDAILEEFPPAQADSWTGYHHENSKKLAIDDEKKLGPFTRQLISELNASSFIAFLEQLTGIEGLLPDPHLWGGGLHQITRGGFLKIHADFNWHKRLRLDRRLNLLVYLNKDWKEEYGGHLELWSADMSRCEKKVLPVYNRCVIFSTTDTSYHGHPQPLTCPEGRSRKSLALYYYSNGRPESEKAPAHSTLYQNSKGARPLLSWLRKK